MTTERVASLHCVEDAALFDCAGDTLVGVLARPSAPREPLPLGVVIVVGGPQYRAGSHRQFVSLARTLADAGHAVLRFDYRGMGDSGGATRDFLGVQDDIGAAIDALQAAAPTVRRVALWGLCDAASAALLYCGQTRDVRVDRLVLLNPWVRSPQGLARMQVKHYYGQRLREPAFWAKLLSGRVALTALSELVKAVRAVLRHRAVSAPPSSAAPFPTRMAHAWNEFDGSMLLLLSEKDFTAKEFLTLAASDQDWQQALLHARLERDEIVGADHTLSDAVHTQSMERRVVSWLTTDTQTAKMAAVPIRAVKLRK